MSSSKHVNVAKMLSWLTSETVLPRVKLNALHNVFMSMPDEEKTFKQFQSILEQKKRGY